MVAQRYEPPENEGNRNRLDHASALDGKGRYGRSQAISERL